MTFDKGGSSRFDPDAYRDEKRRERNRRQKRFAKTVGENFASYALVAIMALTIGSIWSEVGIFSNWKKFIGDALVTVVLYILADVCASYVGTQGGKLDDAYLKDRRDYLELREKVRSAGTVLLDMFCDWQIDVEYEYFIRKKCKDMKVDYDDYMANYNGKTFEELRVLFPSERSPKKPGFFGGFFGGIRNVGLSARAAKIVALNSIERIDLSPDILLTDGMVKSRRGSVGMSGEEYVEKHTVGKGHVALTALIAVVAAVPVFSLSRELTMGAVIYTLFKIALMLVRMYSGFARGARAFNSVEPKHLQSKIKYLNLYLEFLDKRIYEKLGGKYGDYFDI